MADPKPETIDSQPGEQPIIDSVVDASDAMKAGQAESGVIADDLITRALLNPGGVLDIITNSTIPPAQALASADQLMAETMAILTTRLEPIEAQAAKLGADVGNVIIGG